MNCKHAIEANSCSICLKLERERADAAKRAKQEKPLESLEDYMNRKRDEAVTKSMKAIEAKLRVINNANGTKVHHVAL